MNNNVTEKLIRDYMKDPKCNKDIYDIYKIYENGYKRLRGKNHNDNAFKICNILNSYEIEYRTATFKDETVIFIIN